MVEGYGSSIDDHEQTFEITSVYFILNKNHNIIISSRCQYQLKTDLHLHSWQLLQTILPYAAELPTNLRLLHRGFDGFVIHLAEIQTKFWGHFRERWGVLWEMLRVEGELICF